VPSRLSFYRLIFCLRLFCSLMLCCCFLMLSVESGSAQVIFKIVTEVFPMGRAYVTRAAGFAGAAAVGGTIGNFTTDYVKNALKPAEAAHNDNTLNSLTRPTVLCPELSCTFNRKMPDASKTDPSKTLPTTTPPAKIESERWTTPEPSGSFAAKLLQTRPREAIDFGKLDLGSSELKGLPQGKDVFGKVDAGPATEQVPPPPPPLGCEEAGLDGMIAMKRAVVLDDDTGFSKRNEPAARQCYLVAALQRIPIAQYSLADMLLSGDGGPADAARGIQYLEAAARNGLPVAQYRLAQFYETATPADMQRALQWYGEAAIAGFPEAQYELSRFYYQGLGTLRPDRIAAFGWLNVALRNQYPPATETMHTLLDNLDADARAYRPDALFAMGIAWEYGVPGFITADPRIALNTYLNAQRQGWPEAEGALHHLCASTNVCR
jgi:hypothetical protein